MNDHKDMQHRIIPRSETIRYSYNSGDKAHVILNEINAQIYERVYVENSHGVVFIEQNKSNLDRIDCIFSDHDSSFYDSRRDIFFIRSYASFNLHPSSDNYDNHKKLLQRVQMWRENNDR